MKVTVIPVVTGALGTITKRLKSGPGDLDIRGRGETLQTTDFFQIGQNTEECPGNLRRLNVTQTPVENHQLILQ